MSAQLDCTNVPIRTYGFFKKCGKTFIIEKCLISINSSSSEATLRTYCKEIGVEYRESMVNWGALTPEHAKAFSTIKGPNIHFFQEILNSTKLNQQNPTEPDIEDIDEKYREIVKELMPFYLKLRELKLEPTNDNKC